MEEATEVEVGMDMTEGAVVKMTHEPHEPYRAQCMNSAMLHHSMMTRAVPVCLKLHCLLKSVDGRVCKVAGCDLLAGAWEPAEAHAPAVAGGCSGQEMLTAPVRGSCVSGTPGGGVSWAALVWAPLAVAASPQET